jgi:hypothetical protein
MPDGTTPQQLSGTPEEMQRQLAAQAPARFALCEESEDELTSELIGWGLSYQDRAVVCPVRDGVASRFSSAERARWVHSFAAPVQLIWIDEPADAAGVTGSPSNQSACADGGCGRD